jgi:hypothetical protein
VAGAAPAVPAPRHGTGAARRPHNARARRIRPASNAGPPAPPAGKENTMAGVTPDTSGFENPKIETHTDEAKDYYQKQYDMNFKSKATDAQNKTESTAVNIFAKGGDLIKAG